MDNIQNMYTYRTTAENIYSAKSVSGINRFIARFRFAGKMMLLLGFIDWTLRIKHFENSI